MHRLRSPRLVVPLVLLAVPVLLTLWYGDPIVLVRMLDPTACGALLHTPPLRGLTIPEVQTRTGWTVDRAGSVNTYWVVESRAGLGRGGGGNPMPRHERAGPLVLTVDATGRVQRAHCANWTGP